MLNNLVDMLSFNQPKVSYTEKSQPSNEHTHYKLLNSWPEVKMAFEIYGNQDLIPAISNRTLQPDIIVEMLKVAEQHIKKNNNTSLFDGFNAYDKKPEGARRDLFNALVTLLNNHGIKNNNGDFPPPYVLNERFNKVAGLDGSMLSDNNQQR